MSSTATTATGMNTMNPSKVTADGTGRWKRQADTTSTNTSTTGLQTFPEAKGKMQLTCKTAVLSTRATDSSFDPKAVGTPIPPFMVGVRVLDGSEEGLNYLPSPSMNSPFKTEAYRQQYGYNPDTANTLVPMIKLSALQKLVRQKAFKRYSLDFHHDDGVNKIEATHGTRFRRYIHWHVPRSPGG